MRKGCANDIRLGEPLPHALYDANGVLLLQSGVAITSEGQIERLLENGFMVDAEGLCLTIAPAAAVTLDCELVELPVFMAIRVIAEKVEALHRGLQAPGTPDLVAAADAIARHIEEQAARDVDAALASLQLAMDTGGSGTRYVHAAVLCWMLGRALDFDKDQRRTLLVAALVYDAALIPLASQFHNQAEPLNDAQRAEIHRHPERACELLRDAGFQDEGLLRAVLEHHERVDGTGYPAGKRCEEISVEARVLGIVDCFSAMVRPRAYREAVHCKQALRDIFLQRSQSADERLVSLFIKEISMYPPGSLVRLSCGDIAVVYRRSERVACPLVRVLVYANGASAIGHPLRNTCDIGAEVIEGLPTKGYAGLLTAINHLWLDRLVPPMGAEADPGDTVTPCEASQAPVHA